MKQLLPVLALAATACYGQVFSGGYIAGAVSGYVFNSAINPVKAANLPLAKTVTGAYFVSDGVTSTDCGIGGGSYLVFCYSPGTLSAVWTGSSVGASGGGTYSAGTGLTLVGSQFNLTTPIGISNGGNGTGTPSMSSGTGINLTGTWPNYTISSTLSAGTGLTLSAGQFSLNTPVSISNGGNGTASPGITAGTGISLSGTWPTYTVGLTTPISVANGGNGSSSPAIVAGTNVTVSGSWPTQTVNATSMKPGIGMGFDGQGSAISVSKTGYVTSPYACTISKWAATVDTGTITFGVWKVASGTAIPTSSNSIVASAAPAIASGTAANSSTLTGWTTNVSAGDIFGFTVSSVSGATLASLVLTCQ